MKMVKYLIGALIGVTALAVFGCAKGSTKGSTKEEFKYKAQDEADGITVTKTVYEDDKLVIYSNFNEKSKQTKVNVICEDKDYKEIGEIKDCLVAGATITVNISSPKDVHGVKIMGNHGDAYYIRKLQSENYVEIYRILILDLGYEFFGDTENYYTDEEKADMKDKEEEEKKSFNEGYEKFKGLWVSKNGNSTMEIVKDDKDNVKLILRTLDSDTNEWVENTEYVKQFDNFGDENEYDINCSEGDYYYSVSVKFENENEFSVGDILYTRN